MNATLKIRLPRILLLLDFDELDGHEVLLGDCGTAAISTR